MDAAHKFMHGVSKSNHHDAHDTAQLHKMHAHAQDIVGNCHKIFGENCKSMLEEFGKVEKADHITAGHKLAHQIMKSCMKCMKADEGFQTKDKAKGENAAEEKHGAMFKSIHAKASKIADHMMKAGSTYKPQDEMETDDEDEGVNKLAKSDAVNEGLMKALQDATATIKTLGSRIENLERKRDPNMKKGVVGVQDDNGRHESDSGKQTVETTADYSINFDRMAPEAQRQILYSK